MTSNSFGVSSNGYRQAGPAGSGSFGRFQSNEWDVIQPKNRPATAPSGLARTLK